MRRVPILPLVALLFTTALAAQETPLAIQGAVDSELGPLIEAIGTPEPRVIDGFSFWEGKIGGKAVVISRTEVGMVNAAVATTLLIRDYAPRAIINQGTAGATDASLRVGDIVLGEASAPFGSIRTNPRKRGEGIDIDQWEILPRWLRLDGERVLFERFVADPALLDAALETPYDEGRLIRGVVGSADEWNREVDKLLWAKETFGIVSEDMESASVHQVAHLYGVPFLAVRIISNSEHYDPEFRRELGATCAAYVVALAKRLASLSEQPER
ncbi:MAG TPA: 5'-methylthioadenosine/S-adenosylhomocysteine nucleosidase [Vicinamibacteria bacterium]|nr:5'-methylthioadenosine/S-adenosylhomocysteine nucleosidase [Vicinamibacteria bacterium]